MKNTLYFNKKLFLNNIILPLRLLCLIAFFTTLVAGHAYNLFLSQIYVFKIDLFIFPITFLILYAASYISNYVKVNALSFLHFTSILIMFFGYYLIYSYKFTILNTLFFILLNLGIILILDAKIPSTYLITTTAAFIVITFMTFVQVHFYNILVITFFIVLGLLCNHYVMSTLSSKTQIIEDKNRKYLCFHDSLTGLYNRAFFEEELNRLDTARQLPFTVIMGDVNGLKLTNDAFGHKEGDLLLKTIGKILKSSCREEDIIARLGGDEFAIILPKTNEDVARTICQRIKDQCINHICNPIQPSIALGYAIKTMSNENIEKIFKLAENMMYENKIREGKHIRNSIISSLKRHLEIKTSETECHFHRVKKLSIKLAYYMGLSNNEIEELGLLAMFHDIGKAAIPYYILEKPDILSEEELDLVKQHCEIGYRIAMTTAEIASIADLILYHHEHWDGNGYPLGLKKDEIPKLSRIISIVDSYDVMVNNRPYHKAISKDDAIREIKRCSGSQFDPDISELFIDMLLNDSEVCS